MINNLPLPINNINISGVLNTKINGLGTAIINQNSNNTFGEFNVANIYPTDYISDAIEKVVNFIGGVPPTSHASSHLPNGSDPLLTASPTVDLSTSSLNSEGTSNSFSRSDHSHHIDFSSIGIGSYSIGDLLYANNDVSLTKLPLDSGKVLLSGSNAPYWGVINLNNMVSNILPIEHGGTSSSTISGAFSNLSPLTAKGDLLCYSTVNTKLSIGSDYQILTADSSTSVGLKWTSINGTTNRITVNNNTLDISNNYIGQTSITTLGDINFGTWNGDVVLSNRGGTGHSSYTVGDILYANTSTSLNKLNIISGKVLISDIFPSWGTVDLSSMISNVLPIEHGGTSSSTISEAFANLSPLNTKGDILVFSSLNTRLGIGSDTQALTVDSTLATGLKWANVVASVTGTLNRINIIGGNTPIIDISASYIGQTSITTVGDITTGSWFGNTILSNRGGTGFSSYTVGDIFYSDSTNSLSKLNIISGKVLISDVFPSWGTIDLSSMVNNVLPIEYGGTSSSTISGAFSNLSPLNTKGDILCYSTVNTRLGVGSDTQVLTVDSTSSTGIKWANVVASISGTLNRINIIGGNTPTIDISDSYIGQTSITTVGDISSGTWNGDLVLSNRGGTGHSSYTIGDILYSDSTNSLSKLNIINGKVLISGTLPSWGTVDLSSMVSNILPIGSGGTSSSTASEAFSNLSPLNTKGDLLTFSTLNVRLGVGSDSQVLTTDSTLATGLKWTNVVASISGTSNRITSTEGNTPIIDISASYIGQTSITTLGDITIGSWFGNTILATRGGTGFNSYTIGDILYSDSTNSLSKLNIISGKVLISGTLPSWGTVDLSSMVNNILPIEHGGTSSSTASGAFGNLSPLNTKGDLLTFSTLNVRLGVGSDTQVLTADSSMSSGIKWANVVASISGTLNRITSTGGNTPTIDISSTYAGQTSITTVGDISSGNWFGNTILTTRGGTGFNSYIIGDILYSDSTNSLSKLNIINGKVLISGTLPSWGTVDLSSMVSNVLPIGSGGTSGTTSSTAFANLSPLNTKGDILCYSTINTRLGVGANTQVLTADSSMSSGIKWANVVASVTGTLNRITSTGGNTPIIDISASYVGQTSITTVGDISSGNWFGNTILTTRGGTGFGSYTIGDILYSDTSTSLNKLNIISGKVLISGTLPSWGTVDLSSMVSNVLPIGSGGTSGTTSSTAFNNLSPLNTKGDILVFSTINTRLNVGSDSQVLTADSTASTGTKWSTPLMNFSPSYNNFYSTTAVSVSTSAAVGFESAASINTGAITSSGSTNTTFTAATAGTYLITYGVWSNALLETDSYIARQNNSTNLEQSRVSASNAGMVTISFMATFAHNDTVRIIGSGNVTNSAPANGNTAFIIFLRIA